MNKLPSVFQFQYGTIESIPDCKRSGKIFNFNSSMVRLKVYNKKYTANKKKFQFQYGTIESSITISDNRGICVFQFQYGTIESGNYCSSSACISYFNSSMVRLKAVLALYSYTTYPYFNSSMVRLKGVKSKQQRRCKEISIPVWYD